MRVGKWVLGSLVVGGIVLVVAWSVLSDRIADHGRIVKSKDNVKNLMTMMIARRTERSPDTPRTGKAFIDELLAGVGEKDERWDVSRYAGPARLDIDAETKGPVPLIGDLSHEDGAVIGYSDGSVRFLDRSDLGLGPDDPIVAGPDSKSAILRRLSSR